MITVVNQNLFAVIYIVWYMKEKLIPANNSCRRGNELLTEICVLQDLFTVWNGLHVYTNESLQYCTSNWEHWLINISTDIKSCPCNHREKILPQKIKWTTILFFKIITELISYENKQYHYNVVVPT